MPSAMNASKKVAYLWGAGATQAEITYRGSPINLLMRDSLSEGISTRILKRMPKGVAASYRDQHGNMIDIEKLISLLSATGISQQVVNAEAMRQHYFREIKRSLLDAGILTEPKLATALLELHRDPAFSIHEELTGIITTNHDGVLQTAFQNTWHGINIGVQFQSSDYEPVESAPPLLQLHGSFTWIFGVPLKVSRLRPTTPYQANLIWLPPTILKESKVFPFNKLLGAAYELLSKRCDVLRVIGSSLTQNDWNILSLIFNAQRHLMEVGLSPFRIELIMSQRTGDDIQAHCSYLKYLTPIGYLSEGDFSAFKEPDPPSDEMRNAFAYWLKEKIGHHLRKGQLARANATANVLEVAGEPSVPTS